jgi:hypothetical protein
MKQCMQLEEILLHFTLLLKGVWDSLELEPSKKICGTAGTQIANILIGQCGHFSTVILLFCYNLCYSYSMRVIYMQFKRHF